MAFSTTGEVPLYGINYKDPPEQARAWLDELGDPYARIGADRDGRAGIEWGVYGVPETYIVAADGTIAYRHVGPVSHAILNDTLLPIVRRLKTSAPKEVSQ
jgi:cytochrome c biogenesis protein CcmG/thiol:disulfide interchange protein DsbE